MKKKLILLSLFATLFLSSQAQQIFIETTSGETFSELISQIDEMSFPNNNIEILKTDETTTVFNLLQIKKMYFNTITAVEEISTSQTSIALYPNPANDYISVRNVSDTKTDYSIYSIYGSMVLQSTINSSTAIIDISSLSNGIYFLNISGQTIKFIKQ